jgi:thiamine-phosphate pyrophosphorylase
MTRGHDGTRVGLGGLCVILDRRAAGRRDLLDVLQRAAAGGARFFQYRAKGLATGEAWREAARLRRAAAECGALFIVNDRCDLALAVEADGAHLGQADLPIRAARALLGPDRLIGASTHSAEQVLAATREGADYVGFGPIFDTGTKPDHEPLVGLEGLRKVRPLTPLPLLAIGGIGLDRAGEVMACGADGIAVIAAVLGAPDIEASVRAFLAILRR